MFKTSTLLAVLLIYFLPVSSTINYSKLYKNYNNICTNDNVEDTLIHRLILNPQIISPTITAKAQPSITRYSGIRIVICRYDVRYLQQINQNFVASSSSITVKISLTRQSLDIGRIENLRQN